MSKLLAIITIIGIIITILFMLLFIYCCFKLEQLEEKDYNYYDDDIEKK